MVRPRAVGVYTIRFSGISRRPSTHEPGRRSGHRTGDAGSETRRRRRGRGTQTMHRRAVWGLSFALAAGASAPAPAADTTPPESKPWYARLVGGDTKKPEEKTFGDTAARPAVVYGPMDPAAMTEALKAEQAAYQRRLDVCLKLRQ